jgi:hypothetical protein
MVLSVLGRISIVMAWARILIVLGYILSSYSHVLHVVTKLSMIIVVLTWSVGNINRLFYWRLRMDSSRLNLCFSMLVIAVVVSWSWVLIVLCLILSSNSNIFHIMSELSVIVVVLSWRWVLFLM